MNIYLDIDGVLLKKDGALAKGFDEFLDFFVENHEVFWLTPHCRGGECDAIEHITRNNKISDKSLENLKKIKLTDWHSLKTDAIDFSQQFVWFDDYVMSGERKVLLENNAYMRLHTIDLKADENIGRMISINYDRGEPSSWQKIDLELSFSSEEFEKIKKGFVSDRGMDERWRFLFEGDTLYILRHWIANAVYKMDFRFHDGKYISEEVYIVKDLVKDCKELNLFQKNWHGSTIIWLIEKYLLGNYRRYLITSEIVYGNLKIPIDSIHGYNHWKNVEKFGLQIAEENGADKDVISAFAYLHDIGRTHDADEPFHGKKSVRIIKENFKMEKVGLDENRWRILLEAVSDHDIAHSKSNDITIQTCWDADRLDLPRVGEKIDERFLFTKEAKKIARKIN